MSPSNSARAAGRSGTHESDRTARHERRGLRGQRARRRLARTAGDRPRAGDLAGGLRPRRAPRLSRPALRPHRGGRIHLQRSEADMTEDTTLAPSDARPADDVVASLALHGDMARLTPKQQVRYVARLCESLGLNPLTQPFAYLRLQGKLVLYAKKDAAEQLRQKHQVSLHLERADIVDGIYVVHASARLPNGRTDADMGAVDVSNLKGEARCNAMLKAVTKAKRRVTLSICGLGMLDESEIDAIADAAPLDVDPATGEVPDEPSPPAPKPRTITEGQQKRLFAVAKDHGWSKEQLRDFLRRRYGVQHSNEIPVQQYDAAVTDVARGPGEP